MATGGGGQPVRGTSQNRGRALFRVGVATPVARPLHGARRGGRGGGLRDRRGHATSGTTPLRSTGGTSLAFLVLALVVHLGSNSALGLYGRIWRHAGIEEARQVAAGRRSSRWSSCWPSASPVAHARPRDSSRSRSSSSAAPSLTMAMGALRFHSRLFAWQRGSRSVGPPCCGDRQPRRRCGGHPRDAPEPGRGARAGGGLRRRRPGPRPLAPRRARRRRASRTSPSAADRYTIQQVFLAIPNPAPELVERALRAVEGAGVAMKILPSVRDIVAGKPQTVTHPPGPRAPDRGPARPDPGGHRPGRRSSSA